MAICRIKQPEIFSSGVYDDTLNPANAPTAANLEEDLNYIRSVLRSFFGGVAWYDVPTGDFSGVLNAFPIQHYTAADDPAKEGYHKDIISDSLTVNGGDTVLNSPNITFNSTTSFLESSGLFTVRSSANSVLVDSSQDITLQSPLTKLSDTLGNTTIQIDNASGSVEFYNTPPASGSILFFAPASASNKVLNIGNTYEFYFQDSAPASANAGNRLAISGPAGTASAETGLLLGPVGSGRFTDIVLSAETTNVLGNKLVVASDIDTSTTNYTLLQVTSSVSGDGFVYHQTADRHIFAPVVSGTPNWGREFYYSQLSDYWVLETLNYLHIQSSTGYIRVGSANSSHAHFYTDRPDYYFNKTVRVDGGIGFWQISQTKSYRIFVGSTFPVTPQEGDIWFKV